MWWWWKVRRANKILRDVRDELERYGELAVATALARAFDVQSSPMFDLARTHRDHALAWLTERRDIAERKEQRMETVECEILIFVIFGVVIDILLLVNGK